MVVQIVYRIRSHCYPLSVIPTILFTKPKSGLIDSLYIQTVQTVQNLYKDLHTPDLTVDVYVW